MFDKLEWIIIIVAGFLCLYFYSGCAHRPEPEPQEIVFKIENHTDMEIEIFIYKNCEGNWNFCKWN